MTRTILLKKAILVILMAILTVASYPKTIFYSSYEANNEDNDGRFIITNDDIVRMHENRSRTIAVLGNDYGFDEGVASLTIPVPPKHGFAEVTASNTIIYTPDYLFTGTDQLTYKACNTHGLCDEATVYITVQDYDYKPRAINDTIRIAGQIMLNINVLANDKELDDLPINLTIERDLINGFSVLLDNMSLNILINRFFIGGDSLVYMVCDKEGDCSRGVLHVIMIEDNEQGYFIPKGFSPNGDGINDTFNVPGFNLFTNLSIVIFDRNGSVVFVDDYYDNNWTGRANTGSHDGSIVPQGTYYYLMRVPGIEKEITGFIFLAR